MFLREVSPDAREVRGTERDALTSLPDSHLLQAVGAEYPRAGAPYTALYSTSERVIRHSFRYPSRELTEHQRCLSSN